MTNDVLEEYLQRIRAALRDLDDDEQDAVVEEMRAHLETAIEQRMRDDPDATRESATLAETRAFGEPEEIASARLASRPPPAAFDLEPAPPRARRAWKVALALLVPLLLVGAGAAVLAGEPRDDNAPPKPRYERFFEFSNETGVINDTVEVGADVAFLTFHIDVGMVDVYCLHLRIVDPNGTAAFDEELCGASGQRITTSPAADGQQGTWRIEVRYEGIHGWLKLQAYMRSG